MIAAVRKLKVFSVCLLAWAVLLPGSGAAGANSVSDTELQLKAGFIYNFALFVQWPATGLKQANAPLVICIAGESAALPAFDTLKAKKIKDRPVTVFLYGDNATGSRCDIVYIRTEAAEPAAELLKRVSGPGVLTIGDAKGFARLGGIIGFYREGNKLRFEINTDAARRAGLKLSSQLLNLAKIITDRQP